MAGKRINALPVTEALADSDAFVVDKADGTGTKQVSYSNVLNSSGWLSGGVPYGREIDESWAELQARTQTGDFSGLRIGDYKTITLTTGEVVVCEVAGIDTYYRYGSTPIGHHIDFISRDCLAGGERFNTTNTNNGTADEPNPWRASELFQTMNTTVYNTLPSDLKSCIIEKYAHVEKRYSAAGTLNESAGFSYASMGRLWLPTEAELYGWSFSLREPHMQYPIFMHNYRHLVKGAGNGGNRCVWWTSSAFPGDSIRFWDINSFGIRHGDFASTTAHAPLCFRIG